MDMVPVQIRVSAKDSRNGVLFLLQKLGRVEKWHQTVTWTGS